MNRFQSLVFHKTLDEDSLMKEQILNLAPSYETSNLTGNGLEVQGCAGLS